jgi:hypothetical protein
MIRNMHEDLEQLESHNIAGLGITSEEIYDWIKSNK